MPAGHGIQAIGSSRTGGNPYGPGHLTSSGGDKPGLSDDEITIAREYGAWFHTIAEKLSVQAA